MKPAIQKTITRGLVAGFAPQALAERFGVPLAEIEALGVVSPVEVSAPPEEPAEPIVLTAEQLEGQQIDALAVEADAKLKARDYVTSKVVDGEGVLTEEWKAWRTRLRAIRNREVPLAELVDGLPPEPERWVEG